MNFRIFHKLQTLSTIASDTAVWITWLKYKDSWTVFLNECMQLSFLNFNCLVMNEHYSVYLNFKKILFSDSKLSNQSILMYEL